MYRSADDGNHGDSDIAMEEATPIPWAVDTKCATTSLASHRPGHASKAGLRKMKQRRITSTFRRSSTRHMRIDEGFFQKTISALEDVGPRLDFLALLPSELSLLIIRFTEPITVARMSTVSKTWLRLTQEPAIWRHFYSLRWRRPKNSESLFITSQPTHFDWKEAVKTRYILDYNWKNGRVKSSTLRGHEDSVYCLQFDDKKIVTGSRDRTIKFWDIRTRRCYRTVTAHRLSVLCLQYDDNVLASGSSDTTVVIWNVRTMQQIHVLRGHEMGVLDLCFVDNILVTCSKDATIRIWDMSTGAQLNVLTGHGGPVNTVQLKGNNIVSASGDAVIKMWNLQTGQCIRNFVGHSRGLACVQYDGKIIVSGSNDNTIKIWDVETGDCLQTLEGHTDLVRTLHFDEERVVSGSYDQSIRVWDRATGQSLLRFESGHSSWVFDLQFSAGKLISVSQDKSIMLLEFDAGLNPKYLP